jgi:hypothetical protein
MSTSQQSQPQQNKSGSEIDKVNAFIMVRSPFDNSKFIQTLIPPNLTGKEMLVAPSQMQEALNIINGKHLFFNYDMGELGKYGIQILCQAMFQHATSDSKFNITQEHKSRLYGLYGAFIIRSFLEPRFKTGEMIQLDYLRTMVKNNLEAYGPYSAKYVIDVLCDVKYPYQPDRAVKVSKELNDLLTDYLNKMKQRRVEMAEKELAKSKEHIQQQQSQQPATPVQQITQPVNVVNTQTTIPNQTDSTQMVISQQVALPPPPPPPVVLLTTPPPPPTNPPPPPPPTNPPAQVAVMIPNQQPLPTTIVPVVNVPTVIPSAPVQTVLTQNKPELLSQPQQLMIPNVGQTVVVAATATNNINSENTATITSL